MSYEEPVQRYWDHTEKERAELDESTVARLIDFELMEKGVLKPPEKPEFPENPPYPDMKGDTVFMVKCDDPEYASLSMDVFAFSTVEDAEAFLKLGPVVIRSAYISGKSHYYGRKLTPIHGKGEIQAKPVVSEQEMMRHRAELERVGEIRSASKKAMEEYESALRKVKEASADVWEDWHTCRQIQTDVRTVLATLAEYTENTGGDQDMALVFLGKAYGKDRLVKAEEWSGQNLTGPALLAEEEDA